MVDVAHQQLAHITRQQQLQIFSMMGLYPHAPVQIKSLTTVTQAGMPEEDVATILLKNHPRTQAARADYDTAEQQLRLEIREQYPYLSVGPGKMICRHIHMLGHNILLFCCI